MVSGVVGKNRVQWGGQEGVCGNSDGVKVFEGRVEANFADRDAAGLSDILGKSDLGEGWWCWTN